MKWIRKGSHVGGLEVIMKALMVLGLRWTMNACKMDEKGYHVSGIKVEMLM